MSCDSVSVALKIMKVAAMISHKEHMTEDALNDIRKCRVGIQEVRSSLIKAGASLSSANFTGKIIAKDDMTYLEVPIMLELARYVSDFMSVAEDKDSGVDYRTVKIVRDVVQGYHIPVTTTSESGECSVIIKKIHFEDNKVYLHVETASPNVEILADKILICTIQE